MRIKIILMGILILFGSVVLHAVFEPRAHVDQCYITWKSELNRYEGRGDWIVWYRHEQEMWVKKQNQKDPTIVYGVVCR